MEANANGIRNFDGFQLIFWQIPKVMGRSIAIAPMLFMNEERKNAIDNSKNINWLWFEIILFIFVSFNFSSKMEAISKASWRAMNIFELKERGAQILAWVL